MSIQVCYAPFVKSLCITYRMIVWGAFILSNKVMLSFILKTPTLFDMILLQKKL